MPMTELSGRGIKKQTENQINNDIVLPAGCAWSKVSIFGATRVTSWSCWVCANYGGETGIFIIPAQRVAEGI